MGLAIQTRMVDANGLTFEVDMCGHGDRLAICLHGFPELSFAWRHQLPLLARLGYRAWAPNLRGYGRSSRPTSVADYAMRHLLADVAGLIDRAAAESVLLVGHDWGGAIAWQFALQHLRPVDRLVVMNIPHPVRFFEGLRTWRQTCRSWYMAAFQIPRVPELVLGARHAALVGDIFRHTAVDPERFPASVVRVYRDAAARPGALTAMLNYYRALRRIRPSRQQLEALREPLDVPTLLIWGEDDVALGKELTVRTDQLVRQLVLRYLPGVSHWVQQEAPETVNALLEAWLSDRPVPVVGRHGQLTSPDEVHQTDASRGSGRRFPATVQR